MLQSLNLRNVHQTQKSFLVKHFTVGRKHASELERQHAGITARGLLVDSYFLPGCFSVQSAGLKQDRRRTITYDAVHLPAIKRHHVSGMAFDIRACNEWNTFPQGISRPSQDVLPFSVIEIVHITSIHIYRVHQSNSVGVRQVTLKSFDRDLPIQLVWQEGRRYALHLAAKNSRFR